MKQIQGDIQRDLIRDLEHFSNILSRATKKIDADYMQLPVAGREDTIYRERVYCYELYHHLRSAMSQLCPYMLCGELDKSGHPYIRGNSLDRVKPDFLVHAPLSMSENLVAIEVKPVARIISGNASSGAAKRCAIRRDAIKKDLRTLTAFRRDGKYRRAIYLIYGDDDRRFQHIRAGALALNNDLKGIDLELIDLYYHKRSGQSAKRQMWFQQECSQ